VAGNDGGKNDSFGGLWAPLERIRPGPGVVGRTAVIVLALIVLSGVAVVALRDHIWLVLAVFGVDVLFVAGYFIAAFRYAEKFPHFATMEGGEVVRYTELQQAAKEPKLIEGSAEPVANTAPPPSITYRGGNNG
jgi:hypothetical protein